MKLKLDRFEDRVGVTPKEVELIASHCHHYGLSQLEFNELMKDLSKRKRYRETQLIIRCCRMYDVRVLCG